MPPTRERRPPLARKLPDWVGPCLFRRLDDRWLLTNDSGRHLLLDPEEFSLFVGGGLRPRSALWTRLRDGGFLRDRLDFPRLAHDYSRARAFLRRGPSLHILVVTLRCNHRCGYCQAAARAESAAGSDMSPELACRVVDYALQSPSPEITLEFQGGEPLLNWPAVEAAVRHARKAPAAAGRDLRLALVSNLTALDDSKLAFLVENRVGLCTSLDGPADLHDANRPYGGGSHATVERRLRRIRELYPDKSGPLSCRPGALLTVSKRSLGRAREVVDEYARLGFDELFVRPVAPIGAAAEAFDEVGVRAEEFLPFYRDCLSRVLELDASGRPMRERGAAMLLEKILRGTDPGFVDLRSPCGAALGQLAYGHDGAIYTCDEGRMLAADGDSLFRVGSVFETPYAEALAHPTVKACAVASCLEEQPVCSSCVYKPFCGVCPVYNYARQDTIWGRMPTNDRCAVYMGIFDHLFRLLQDRRFRPTLERWAGLRDG